MEGSFAEELYSESLQLSEVEHTPPPAAMRADSGGDGGSLKDEDESIWGGSDDEFNELDREWGKKRDQFHTIGYREGVIAGKEAISQEGFNIGFKEAVVVGYDWGIVRGVTSALFCLPNELQEKLIETLEKRNKFRTLYESVASLSTTDALKLYHDDLITKNAVGLNVVAEAAPASDVQSLHNECSSSTLGDYVDKLQSLLLESPSIESHLSVK